MKLAVVVLCCFFAAACAVTTFENLPGTTDAEKVSNIQAAVAQTRVYAAGQACFTAQFLSPADPVAISHWGAWLCSYLGGPADLDGCAWFQDFGSNDTFTNGSVALIDALNTKHISFPISTQMLTMFTSLLSTALVTTDTTTLAASDLIPLFANLTASPSHEDDGCAVADTVIQWGPSTAHVNSVKLNGLVSWVWADDNMHSVNIDGPTPVLQGFGSGQLFLARTKGCTQGNAASPSGGTACNLALTSNFTYSQIFLVNSVIDYADAQHAGLTGELTVGTGGTGTGTNTNTNPVDLTDTNSIPGDGTSGGSSASVLSSWLF